MVIKGESNNKKIKIEIIKSGRSIIDKKKNYIYNTFKNINLDDILDKLNKDELNYYVNVKVYKNNILFDKHEDLFYSQSIYELMEVLLIMFTTKEWYEVSKIIHDYLNNIKY